MTTVQLPSGASVECEWSMPTLSEGSQARPLVFLVPSGAMQDINGNGPEIPVRNALLDLSRAFNHQGFATFRFEQGRPITHADLVVLYEKSLQHPWFSTSRAFMVGFGEGADLIARHYYELFQIRRLDAAILLSSTVQPIHLNNFTCAYLLLHGMNDPLFQAFPYKRLEDAVHRHQARYGDQTTNFLFPFLGRELGKVRIDRRVILQAVEWCSMIAKSSKHPLSRYGDIRSRERPESDSDTSTQVA